MVFVADEIPLELASVVEFLNVQMDPADVLAVEVKQFANESVQTLVPRLIGLTAEAQNKKGPASRQWNEESFFEELAKRRGGPRLMCVTKYLSGRKSIASSRPGERVPKMGLSCSN